MSVMSPSQVIPDMLYVFKDAMSPHILLLYDTSEQLGILQFNVPYLVAHVHIDAISLPTPGGWRKTAKTKMVVSCKDPLTSQIPSHTVVPPSLLVAVERGRP